MTKAELRRCKRLSGRQLRRNSKCEAALHREHATAAAKHHRAKPMSKAELRRCHGMTYRQLLHHQDCAAQLQSELDASKHAKHGSGKHKAAERLHKSPRHKDGRRHAARRHHRS